MTRASRFAVCEPRQRCLASSANFAKSVNASSGVSVFASTRGKLFHDRMRRGSEKAELIRRRSGLAAWRRVEAADQLLALE